VHLSANSPAAAALRVGGASPDLSILVRRVLLHLRSDERPVLAIGYLRAPRRLDHPAHASH